MKKFLCIFASIFCSLAMADPLFLECAVAGKSFDQKFTETVGIKIDGETIDVVSEEFPMFAKVQVSDTTYKATKNFTSPKGVKYFFSIELDRVSGRFIAYETSAFPDRKIYNTTGTGPCTKISESRFLTIKPNQSKQQQQPVKVTIRRPE